MDEILSHFSFVIADASKYTSHEIHRTSFNRFNIAHLFFRRTLNFTINIYYLYELLMIAQTKNWLELPLLLPPLLLLVLLLLLPFFVAFMSCKRVHRVYEISACIKTKWKPDYHALTAFPTGDKKTHTHTDSHTYTNRENEMNEPRNQLEIINLSQSYLLFALAKHRFLLSLNSHGTGIRMINRLHSNQYIRYFCVWECKYV